MNAIEACQKCGSDNTYEIHTGTFAEWCQNLLGYQPCRCRECAFQWNRLLPLHTFFNLIYILLATEISFLFWQYLHWCNSCLMWAILRLATGEVLRYVQAFPRWLSGYWRDFHFVSYNPTYRYSPASTRLTIQTTVAAGSVFLFGSKSKLRARQGWNFFLPDFQSAFLWLAAGMPKKNAYQ